MQTSEKYGILKWKVKTDRGIKEFDIKNRHHDIKTFYDGRVLVLDSDDNCYEITYSRTVGGKMKLIIAIVNNEDAKVITPKLMEEGFSATTLNTTGGFLRAGNTTLLVATEEENIEKVRTIFAQYSNTRNTVRTSTTSSLGRGLSGESVAEEVTVGGAVIFLLDVDDVHKF